MTRASTRLHACQHYGNKRDVFNQHNKQHTDSYGRVLMHVYMHLAFNELRTSGPDQIHRY